MGELDTDTIGLFVTLAGLAAVFVAAKLQRRAGRRPRMPSPRLWEAPRSSFLLPRNVGAFRGLDREEETQWCGILGFSQ